MAPLWLWTIAALCVGLVWKAVTKLLLKPWILEAKLRRQGIRGPPRSILSGNVKHIFEIRTHVEAKCIEGPITHDIMDYVQPHHLQWAKLYGQPLRWWWGSEPGVVLTDLDMIKEVLYNKAGAFWNSNWQRQLQIDLLGRGMAVVNGDEWALRRRILAPAFHADKIKASERKSLQSSSLDIKSCSSCYKQGHRVFELLDQVGELVYRKFSSQWIQSKLPFSKINRDIKAVNAEVRSTLEEIVQVRKDQTAAGEIEGYGSDLLGVMLKEVDAEHYDAKTGLSFTIDGLMEECKTFYIAGHNTSAK
ncbi:hypothetical protein SELMODRAFT_405350 [Selaginella moellendorffii]|uniref:Cytochrome P450 n=1 Tax=Selaginella moellendorffii TaxID=88036 RepID=D8QX24_SELML|nr:hypothetical protein SELMODRAFT_405350 [Selaginella moellendorffii]